MWTLKSLILLTAAIAVPKSKGFERESLEDIVHHYEGLNYEHRSVDDQHQRHKRSASEEVRIDFKAHGRDFKVRLRRDLSVFSPKVVYEAGSGNFKNPDLNHIYEGHLEDEGPRGSHCYGAIRDGVFDGWIATKDGVYYVERSRKFKNSNFSHSVIYHERHLKDPFRKKREGKGGGVDSSHSCGGEAAAEWMNSVQLSEVDTKPKHYKYTREANVGKRSKRSTIGDNRKTCSLYIQTDPLFWKHIHDEENKDDAKTEEEILSLIAQHVKAVNRIYSDTEFNGKYKHHGYQFEVQRIKIHNYTQCEENRPGDNNNFCIPNIDVSNFLNLHSKSNHEEFCLAYVFTYRDFSGGTLGLAWVASATGASGGICETYKSYKENINGERNTTRRSLNTGIITFVNYNSRVPPKVSQLTLAHEIGHNFGSPHDYPQHCRPGGKSGNFIMFASATSGDRYNNNKFSNCSKHNVSRVLDAIVDDLKPNCFKESEGAFCGNKIVEIGEECDCGYDEHECQEQCCHPRQSSDLSDEDNKLKRCTRKPGAQCSPSEGPCCDQKCNFLSEYDNVLCKEEDDCTAAALCDGSQAKCPKPKFKPDNETECNEGTQVCQQGECKDSICLKYKLVSCFLTSDVIKDKRQLCQLACQQPGKNGTCMSTSELVANGDLPGLVNGLSLRPGSPCDNFQGYCDVFLKCRKVDAEGPLVRLKNLLFNQETLLTIAQWVTDFWWAVLLMGIAFVIFMAVFIRCFAIHTPSSNPRLPKNLHFTETLRRPVRSLQYKHYRPANGSSSHQGAPPPYPGRGGGNGSAAVQAAAACGPRGSAQPGPSSAIPGGGPARGYSEGRGHYNRSRSKDHHFPTAASGSEGRGGRGGGHRGSRIEMQPMR